MKEVSAVEKLKAQYPTIYTGYAQVMAEQFELFSRKMLDYGVENISMGSALEDPEDKKLSLTAIWIRCNDKMSRLKNLVVKGKSAMVQDESSIDSYQDLVNYGIISQLVSKGKWKK